MQFMNRQKSFIITLIVLTLFALISMSFKIKPMVKAYEEFLQSYLNAHPSIGDKKLLKALEQTC